LGRKVGEADVQRSGEQKKAEHPLHEDFVESERVEQACAAQIEAAGGDRDRDQRGDQRAEHDADRGGELEKPLVQVGEQRGERHEGGGEGAHRARIGQSFGNGWRVAVTRPRRCSSPVYLAIPFGLLAWSVNGRLADVFAGDRSASEEATIATVQGAGRLQQLKEAVINLVSLLL
jgi:hypothetical protein